jgi:C-methyltransferase C-terminal domain/Putative zinc binding domain
MNKCRGCGEANLSRVVDLGKVPVAKHFPLATEPVSAEENSHALAMDMCDACGLAQLAEDDTVLEEAQGVESQALKDQAQAAIKEVAAANWLRGSTVREFGSPHGGTWIPLLTDRGFTAVASQADVVLDCFGAMHEPDQRAAFARRAEVTGPDGVLLLQYHPIVTMVALGQWNALRHGHFVYYSMTTLSRLLGAVGLWVHSAWEFSLYGGTVLLAATHGEAEPDESVRRILNAEDAMGITTAEAVVPLQQAADQDVDSLRSWLEEEADAGRTVVAYAAASKAVSLFSRAGISSRLIAAVADASPAKQGRRMPGTDIPIVSPDELLAAKPDRVLLTLPDLLPEVRARFPELDSRWKVHGQ